MSGRITIYNQHSGVPLISVLTVRRTGLVRSYDQLIGNTGLDPDLRPSPTHRQVERPGFLTVDFPFPSFFFSLQSLLQFGCKMK